VRSPEKQKYRIATWGSHFASGRRPGEEGISIWNAFLEMTRAQILQAAKERSGLGDREDIQTWVDLHDAEEGRTSVAILGH
jgi:hypothetical protein